MKWLEKNWIWVLIAFVVIYFLVMRRRPEEEEVIEEVAEESGYTRTDLRYCKKKCRRIGRRYGFRSRWYKQCVRKCLKQRDRDKGGTPPPIKPPPQEREYTWCEKIAMRRRFPNEQNKKIWLRGCERKWLRCWNNYNNCLRTILEGGGDRRGGYFN